MQNLNTNICYFIRLSHTYREIYRQRKVGYHKIVINTKYLMNIDAAYNKKYMLTGILTFTFI